MSRPHLIVLSKDFQVVFVNLVYNSGLFLASCCSFLLYVVVNLICIVLVSRQLVLLFPKFSSFLLWYKTVYPLVLLKNFNSIDANRFLSFFKGPNFAAI